MLQPPGFDFSSARLAQVRDAETGTVLYGTLAVDAGNAAHVTVEFLTGMEPGGALRPLA